MILCKYSTLLELKEINKRKRRKDRRSALTVDESGPEGLEDVLCDEGVVDADVGTHACTSSLVSDGIERMRTTRD
jgi:hypothetical protein